jgi:hypothetical protein
MIADPHQMKTMIEEVQRCLKAAGEDLTVAMPLLSAVMPFFIKENRFTSTIGPDGRIALLCGIIERLINFYTKSRPLAIFLDDVHRYAF